MACECNACSLSCAGSKTFHGLWIALSRIYQFSHLVLCYISIHWTVGSLSGSWWPLSPSSHRRFCHGSHQIPVVRAVLLGPSDMRTRPTIITKIPNITNQYKSWISSVTSEPLLNHNASLKHDHLQDPTNQGPPHRPYDTHSGYLNCPSMQSMIRIEQQDSEEIRSHCPPQHREAFQVSLGSMWLIFAYLSQNIPNHINIFLDRLCRLLRYTTLRTWSAGCPSDRSSTTTPQR